MRYNIILLLISLVFVASCKKDSSPTTESLKANAEIIAFRAEKCGCCWGWVIRMGTDTIKGALGVSGATLNSTPAVTATLPFRIEGLWSDYAPAGTPGTDNTSNYNLVVVSANTQQQTGI